MKARELPKVRFGKKVFFFDKRLSELRNVDNPHDYISLDGFEAELIEATLPKDAQRNLDIV